MASIRSRRISEQIKKEVAMIVATEINDPRVQDVVITDTVVSPDLRTARVYFSSYNREAIAGIEAGLADSTGYIWGVLRRRLRMRRTPTIKFEKDPIPDKTARIEQLLEEDRKKE
jgi:ribosome-binding factor A